MLNLLLILAIVAFVTFMRFRKKYKEKRPHERNDTTVEFFTVVSSISGCIIFGLLIPIAILSANVLNEDVLDMEIKMYQEENAIIEQDINKILKEYLEQKHKQGKFLNLKTEENLIIYIPLFSELNDNTYIQKQIDVYLTNNDKIRNLREDKFNIPKMKWLLYLGGN